MNARNSAKRATDILKYFEEPFLHCDTAGMVFSGLAADRLLNMRVKRGYVDKPEHWRWSSARNYAGQDNLLDVFMDW